MKTSLRALNQLVTQAITAALLFAIVMIAASPVTAGNRLVARNCDAAILAPAQAYTAPACNQQQNFTLQQRDLGDGSGYSQCPQGQAAAIVDYGTTQRYTIVPQVQRYQLQQVQTPRAQKVLLVQNNNQHYYQHQQAIRQQQQQVHHHNVAQFRQQNNGSRRTVTTTKTVTRSSRR